MLREMGKAAREQGVTGWWGLGSHLPGEHGHVQEGPGEPLLQHRPGSRWRRGRPAPGCDSPSSSVRGLGQAGGRHHPMNLATGGKWILAQPQAAQDETLQSQLM